MKNETRTSARRRRVPPGEAAGRRGARRLGARPERREKRPQKRAARDTAAPDVPWDRAEREAPDAAAARGALTLRGAFELWRVKALSQNLSPVTIENTASFMAAIYRFLPADTLLGQLNEDAYYRLCADLRAAGYSEETLFSLNATFRKIINYSYKKRLLPENPLSYADNLKTAQKRDHRILLRREFELLDGYFQRKNASYRFLIQLLYYTGIRISEALAVTYADFEEFRYDKRPNGLSPGGADGGAAQLSGTRVRITKSYISKMKLEKDTKNHKSRAIPLSPAPAALYAGLRAEHLRLGGSADDRVFPVVYQTVNSALKRACASTGIPPVSCHDFRHTFISNLIRKNVPLSVIERVTGDTQTTILRRYSHIFGNDEVMILDALRDI